MDVLVAPKLAPPPSPAEAAAEQVRMLLREKHEIHADVHSGSRVALLSIWTGLVVYVYPAGNKVSWAAGRNNPRTGRTVYAIASLSEPARAAARIARRYHEIREAERAGRTIPPYVPQVSR